MAEARRPVVDLFCEDHGHEAFFRALAARIAEETSRPRPHVRAISSRGGKGRTMTELRAWLRSRLREPGDLLVVLIDANGDGWSKQRAELLAELQDVAYPLTVVGCAEPEIEAWCLADPKALQEVYGAQAPLTGDRKNDLVAALRAANVPILGDASAVALDLVPVMDLHQAGRNEPSLRAFAGDLRAALSRLPA